jgi:PASTA domain
VEEVRTEETAERLAEAIRQRDEARKAAQGARARYASLVKAAREAEETAHRDESRVGPTPKAAEAGRIDDQPKPRSQATGGSGRAGVPATEKDPGAERGKPAWSWRSALPSRRRWLGLLVLFVATALLAFLLARPDADPATGNRSGVSTGNTAGPRSLVMPDLRGLTYDEALLRLEELDLAFGRRVRTQGEPAVVVATDPGLGRLVGTGTEVTVFVGADAAGGEAALDGY